MGDERTDLERVGHFVDGPYDTAVTLFRPDVAALFGRDGSKGGDDPLRLGGPMPIAPGFKLKNALNDWTFTPFLYLWEGEPYTPPGHWRNEYRKQKAEGMISESPFLSMSGEKWMNGLGTYYGTFIKEMESFSPEMRPKVDDDDLKGVSQMMTNPGKKGSGYGYVPITINTYPEHMDDPAFNWLEQHQKMREDFESRFISEAKWMPTGPGKEYFNANPYFNDQDPEGTTATYDWDRLIKPAEPDDRPLWILSNYTKSTNGNKDVISPFERFPAYDPSSPYVVLPYNIFRILETDPEKPPWRAQFGNRSHYTRSVIQFNIKLWVNSTNFHLF